MASFVADLQKKLEKSGKARLRIGDPGSSRGTIWNAAEGLGLKVSMIHDGDFIVVTVVGKKGKAAKTTKKAAIAGKAKASRRAKKVAA